MKLNNWQWLFVGGNIVSIFLFSIWIGTWLDQKFNQGQPRYILVFLIAAILASIYLFVKIYKASKKN